MDAAVYNMERCPFMHHILKLCGPFEKGFSTPKIGYMYWMYHIVRMRIGNAIADSSASVESRKILDNRIQDDLTDMQVGAR
jgi:hypothetical protein